MANLMTEADFLSKIEYEGGIFEAIHYGLKASECEPGKVRDEFQKIEDAIKSVSDSIRFIDRAITSLEYVEEEDYD